MSCTPRIPSRRWRFREQLSQQITGSWRERWREAQLRSHNLPVRPKTGESIGDEKHILDEGRLFTLRADLSVHHAISIEERCAHAQHFKHEHAKRPPIHNPGIAQALQHLGRDVFGSTFSSARPTPIQAGEMEGGSNQQP